jgi:hypothetical protein
MKITIQYIIIITSVFIFSCESIDPIRDNPLDDEGDNYLAPTIVLLSDVSDGDTLYASSIEFQWEGNELVTEYRFQYDTFSWSDWSDNTAAILDYLDEGEHTLSIQSQYLTGDTSEVGSVSFVVDAVSGPALMFYPRRHLANINETVTFHIMAEEVSNLMAAQIHLEFEPSLLEIVSVEQGGLFIEGQNSIFLYEVNQSDGTIQINTTLLDAESPSVSGTGELAVVRVKLIQSGSATLNFNGNDIFKDQNNNNMMILEKVNGLVEVK